MPRSPFSPYIEGKSGDASKCRAYGPGVEPTGVMVDRPTWFDIDATSNVLFVPSSQRIINTFLRFVNQMLGMVLLKLSLSILEADKMLCLFLLNKQVQDVFVVNMYHVSLVSMQSTFSLLVDLYQAVHLMSLLHHVRIIFFLCDIESYSEFSSFTSIIICFFYQQQF